MLRVGLGNGGPGDHQCALLKEDPLSEFRQSPLLSCGLEDNKQVLNPFPASAPLYLKGLSLLYRSGLSD